MYKRHEIGKYGEEQATKYLCSKEYKIIERNFECKQGEIDIIALDKKELVFVEVKTRTDNMYGEPAEAVTNLKIKHLQNTIEYYLYVRNLENENVRIDVIEVYFIKNNVKINHIKKAIE